MLDEAFSSWHQLCDSGATFQPTTAPLSEISSDRNDNYCLTLIRGACTSVEAGLASCLDPGVITNGALFTSCSCAPALIIQGYSCEFLGNTSCLATGATLESLAISSGCDNFASVISSYRQVSLDAI